MLTHAHLSARHDLTIMQRFEVRSDCIAGRPTNEAGNRIQEVTSKLNIYADFNRPAEIRL